MLELKDLISVALPTPGSSPWHMYTVQLLIEYGADVNIKNVKAVTHHYNAATEAGYVPIIELLISNGAHVNEKDNDGKTPLHYAIKNIEATEKLLLVLTLCK